MLLTLFQAETMLKTELQKCNILDARFNQLAANHEEMIRIKDEYKRINKDLVEENDRLKEENSRLFSKTLAEKDDLIFQLEKRCVSAQEQHALLEQKLRCLQNEVNSFRVALPLKKRLRRGGT